MPIANALVASNTPIERSALPVVSELVQQVRELRALVFSERRERLAECFTPLTSHTSSDLAPFIRQGDARASRVIGIRFTPNETVRDPLLHEPRGARLIDADRRTEVTHTQGRGCRGERLEHPQPRRPAEASGRVVHPRRHVGMPRAPMTVIPLLEVIGVGATVPAVRPTHSAGTATAFARTTSAQSGQGAGDGLGGVVLFGAHESILHAT